MNILCCAKSDAIIKNYPTHSHPAWEVIVNKKGHVTSRIGSNTYEIDEGDIIIIPPDTEHNGNSVLGYSDIFFQAYSLDFLEPFIVHDLDNSVSSLMDMLHKVMTEKEKNYYEIAESLVETICQYIKKYSKLGHHFPFVNEIKNTIYRNIPNQQFDLSAEISKSGYNSDYFRRCFKKELGKTPLEYLTALRIDQSKVLLKQDTFISIENVSCRCGFNDSFYFSTCFKKHTGISPLQYRNKIKKQG